MGSALASLRCMERRSLVAAGVAALAAAAFVQVRTRAAERHHRPRGRFMDVDGVRVHYLERGEGTPLVLLHGLGSMIDDFVLSGLVARGAERYRVIAIDRPGYGLSSRPRSRLWTAGAQAELVHRVLRRLDAEYPVLFGHSFGATVAMAYALRHPVERLILASGYYYPSVRFDMPFLLPPAIPVLGDLLRYTVSPIVGRLLWPAWLKLLFAPAPVTRRFKSFPTWLALRPLQLRAVGEDNAMLLPAVLAMRPEYRRLRPPTVIVAGGGDRYVSARAHSVRLHEELRGSELVLVPDAGHMVHHVAAAAVMDAIAPPSAEARVAVS